MIASKLVSQDCWEFVPYFSETSPALKSSWLRAWLYSVKYTIILYISVLIILCISVAYRSVIYGNNLKNFLYCFDIN